MPCEYTHCEPFASVELATQHCEAQPDPGQCHVSTTNRTDEASEARRLSENVDWSCDELATLTAGRKPLECNIHQTAIGSTYKCSCDELLSVSAAITNGLVAPADPLYYIPYGQAMCEGFYRKFTGRTGRARQCVWDPTQSNEAEK